MPKKVKTKKAKKLSDLRRKKFAQAIENTDWTTYSITTSKKTHNMPTENSIATFPNKTHRTATISISGYEFLKRDLMKTTLLTSSVIIAEILIKFFLKV